MPPLTSSQRAALSRRTTPTSKSRLLARIRGTAAPAQKFAPPVISQEDAFALTPAADVQRRQVDANYANTMQDYGIQRNQGANDFALGNQQAQQDYQTALGNLNRRYATLQQNQTQNAYAAGGGTQSNLQEQARIRSQNLGLDKAPVQTGYERGVGRRATGYERLFGSQGRVTLGERRAGENQQLQDYGLYQQAVEGLINAGYVPPQGAPVPPAPPPSSVPSSNPYAPPTAIKHLGNGQYAVNVNGRPIRFSGTPGQVVTIGGKKMTIPT